MKKQNIGSSAVSGRVSLAAAIAVTCGFTVSHAYAVESLDKSLFKSLNLVEESVKRMSMESSITESLGSQALSDGHVEILGKIVDDVSSTTKGQYYYRDLEVIGAMAFTHQSGLTVDSEHQIAPINVDVNPRLNAQQAYLIAQGEVGSNPMRMSPTLKILPSLDRTNAELVYVVDFASNSLRSGADVYLNANTGAVIAKVPHQFTMAPINVFNNGPTRKLFIQELFPNGPVTKKTKPIGCVTLDAQTKQKNGGLGSDCDKIIAAAQQNRSVCEFLDATRLDPKDLTSMPIVTVPEACQPQVVGSRWVARQQDPSSAKAFRYAQMVATYYQTVHNRNSYDDRGAPLNLFVNAGYRMSNAFWDSENENMHFGEGDGANIDNLANFVDIAGHEMTHGVVSKTAALLMRDENGALNEAFADFFGKMIENKGSWAMGQGMFLQHRQLALRDLENPGSIMDAKPLPNGKFVKAPMPANYNEKYTGGNPKCDENNDFCFVHSNSTIPSHAMFLMAKNLGVPKAQKIVFQALTKRMSATSNFHDASRAMRAACRTMLPENECAGGVDSAWAQVGL